MKNSQYLTNYQKQQYTIYLQTQLQKFSSFMLKQSKENQNYKFCHETLIQHKLKIQQLNEKLNLILITQKNLAQKINQNDGPYFGFSHLESKISKLQKNIENINKNKPKLKNQFGVTSRQLQDFEAQIQQTISKIQQNLQDKVNLIEQQLENKKNYLIKTRNSLDSVTPISYLEYNDQNKNKQKLVRKKDIQLLQKKMKDYCKKKIQKAINIIKNYKIFNDKQQQSNSNQNITNFSRQNSTFILRDNSFYQQNNKIKSKNKQKGKKQQSKKVKQQKYNIVNLKSKSASKSHSKSASKSHSNSVLKVKSISNRSVSNSHSQCKKRQKIEPFRAKQKKTKQVKKYQQIINQRNQKIKKLR